MFSTVTLKLIKVYTLSDWERFHGFKDDELKTDVLYWISNSKMYQFRFNATASGLTQYKFNSDFIANEYTTLLMKQILVNSN